MMAITKTVEITVERTIPATPAEVFDAWLDPAVPGAFGHESEQLIVDLKTDGLWYWRSIGGTPHYGRFLEIARPARIQHSWMSPNTLGKESIVTVTFQKKESGTLMTILHSGLPDAEMAAAHEKGWNSILDKLCKSFAGGSRRQRESNTNACNPRRRLVNTLQSVGRSKETGYAPVNGLNMYYEITGDGEPLIYIPAAFAFSGITDFPELAPPTSTVR